MNIRDLERTVRTESSAARYLAPFCVSPGGQHCPECGGRKLYRIENGRRLRCAICRYSFHIRTGRWINRVKIGLHDWIWIIKLFELEAPASVIAQETGISYPTVLKAVDTIRASIASAGGPTCHPEHRPSIPAAGWHFIGRYTDGDGAERSRGLPAGAVTYASRIGEKYLILTRTEVPYTSLIVNGDLVDLVDRGVNYPRKRAYCNCGGFWPFLKERLVKHHGISERKLHLYFREAEFRWLHRESNIFEDLVRSICRPAPEALQQEEYTDLAI